jgi:hypothetical protein
MENLLASLRSFASLRETLFEMLFVLNIGFAQRRKGPQRRKLKNSFIKY